MVSFLTLSFFCQIKRGRVASDDGDVDDGISNYDYDNQNDRENFCPGVEEDRFVSQTEDIQLN